MWLDNVKKYVKDAFINSKGHLLFLFFFFLILGFLFVTLNAYALSPIYPQVNLTSYDGPYFALMGERMVEYGAIPYVDFYDIKGPYLFYFEALCAYIMPFYGAYIFQCHFSGLGLFFIYLVIEKMVPAECILKRWVLLSIYAIFAFAFMEGNVPEDLFLFLPNLSLYLFLWFKEKRNLKRYILVGFVEGMMVGFFLFLKVNLLFVPGAVLCFLLFYAISDKIAGKCMAFLSFAFLGLLFFVLPPILIYQGMGELSSLIEWNFLREFSYLGTHNWELDRIFVYITSLALFLYFAIYLFYRRKNFSKEQLGIGVFLLFFQTFVALLSYVSMRHLRFALPVYIFLAVYPLSSLKEEKRLIRLSLKGFTLFTSPFLLCCYLGFLIFSYVTPTRSGVWVYEAFSHISSSIPLEEKENGTVLAIDMPAGVYFDIDVSPNFIYPAYHSIHAVEFVPEMMELVTSYMKEEATWLLVNDAPYEHPEVTPIYEQEPFINALKEANFELREDLSYEGLCLVYEKVVNV